MLPKSLINIYAYVHKLGTLSSLVIEESLCSGQESKERCTTPQRLRVTSKDTELSARRRHLHQPPTTKTGNISEEEKEKVQEWEDGKESCDVFSAGDDKTAPVTNSP